MKKILSFALALALILGMAGCAGSGSSAAKGGTEAESPGEAGVSAVSDDALYKDTIVWVIGSDQDSLDPQVNVSNDKVIPQFYSGLLRVSPDGEIVPDIAESYEVAADNMTWTFNLRQDVTFHNGKGVTAHDFEATFARLLDEANPMRYTTNYTYVEYAKAAGDYTFEIKTKEPKGSFIASIANQATYVLDPEFIAQYGAALGETPESVNGTGPYRCVSWAKGEELVFEAYEDCYRGAPKTKTIIMQVVPEQNSRALAIETGECDIADGISPDDAVRLDGLDGITVSKTPGIGMHLFQFNVQSGNAPMKDPKIRQAISLAVDRQLICDTLFSGLGEQPIHDVVSPVVVGYKDAGVVQRDLEKAKALLAEAGYPDGFEMVVMTTALYNRGVEMAEMIAEQLKEIGIGVTLEVVERAVFVETLNGLTPAQLKYDMFIMGAGGSLDYDQAVSRICKTDPGGTNVNNYGFYSNARLDELLTEGAVTVDPARRLEIYTECSQILLYDDPFGIYLNHRNNVYALSGEVVGFKVNASNTMDLASLQLVDKG